MQAGASPLDWRSAQNVQPLRPKARLLVSARHAIADAAKAAADVCADEEPLVLANLAALGEVPRELVTQALVDRHRPALLALRAPARSVLEHLRTDVDAAGLQVDVAALEREGLGPAQTSESTQRDNGAELKVARGKQPFQMRI